MTYQEMGMKVWFWGYLCIKSIAKDSIFRNTALRSTDHITRVNDIDTDTMTEEQFAHVVDSLHREIQITVLRRKQRLSGMFG